MKTPNPFSFKALTPKKHKKFLGYAIGILGILVLGILFVLSIQKNSKYSVATAVVPQISEETNTQTDESAPQETQRAGIEPLHESPPLDDVGEEVQDSKLSPLSQIYIKQEKQKQPFFQEKVWHKHVAPCVAPTRKIHVAVIIKDAQNLTPVERSYLIQAGIPVGFWWTVPPQSKTLTMISALKKSEFYATDMTVNKIPRCVGIITAKGSVVVNQPYLRFPISKTRKYHYFTFPLIQEKSAYEKAPRVLITLTPRQHRIRNFVEWVKVQQKRVIFIPPSQLVSGFCKPKNGINPQLAQKAQSRAR